MPLAAHATLQGQVLSVQAAWGEPEGGARLVTAHTNGSVSTLADAELLGLNVANALKSQGAH
jgi:hydroxymethylbilane synthase